MNKKKMVITSGDPAGCGPLISLKAIDAYKAGNIEFFLVGDKKNLQKIPIYQRLKNKITLVDANTSGIDKLKKGYSTKLSGQASLNYLYKALEVMKSKSIKRLVTAPLSKEAVQLNLPEFRGHTEFLAESFGIKNVVMMMASEKLKVALFTRHIPLRKIFSTLKKRDILNTLSLVNGSLKKQFRIRKPKIAFASLNPHAGVDTFVEKEEKIILKAISEFKSKIFGPYPCDTLFTPQNLKKYDCIICAYHDQAMLPFKLLSMKDGVNVSLGLPIVRTSPAHGVAYDIIKNKKTPFYSSMLAAIKLAAQLSP